METEKSLVRTSDVQLPKFVADAYDTIEGMKQFAGMLLDSKLVPDHFFEKGADNKPDYTKGKVPAVVVVLLQAQQLAIPPMTALQHVIPVNGLLSIKGDLAKTMIFASGKLRKDSWKEVVTGSIEAEDMVVTLTATREDNGASLTRSFSVEKAKRMGLWITTAQVNSADGWKWKKSAWYKTPDRMLMYRALGNIARDLFSDVLLNMYTTEEAQDIGKETTEVIETESGAKITIPDKDHSQKRSGKMTERVADRIKTEGFAAVQTNVSDAVVVNDSYQPATTLNNVLDAVKTPENTEGESPFIPSKGSTEFLDGKEVKRESVQEVAGQYTLAGMEAMDTEVLKKIVMADMDMMEAAEMIGVKNTNKKLREIIFAHQNNGLREYVAEHLPKPEIPPAEPPVDTMKGEIPINRDFDKQKEDAEIDAFLSKEPKTETKAVSGNKYNIEIPEALPRDFAITKQLYNKLLMLTPRIDNNRYLELAEKKGILVALPDKETFLKNATTKMVNELLDSN